MSAEPPVEGYEAAADRVERAIARLEASLRSLNGRVRGISRIEAEVAKLERDRAQLSDDLVRANARSRKLDDSAGEVSRRLVVAMETMKSVIAEDGKA